jgi:tetratricopeptide (TPR) repeat protein
MRTNPSSLGPDFLLVGFKGDTRLDERIMAQRLVYSHQSKNVSLNNHRVLYPLIVSEDLQTLFGNGPINTDARPWLEFSAPKLLYANDPMINERLNTNLSLKKETLAIMKEAETDVDFQIDFAEFALSVIRPEMAFQNPVNLSRASKSQKDRLYSIMKEFCTNNIVTEFSLFGDEELKKACIITQIEKVQQRHRVTEEKTPLYIHLGSLQSEMGMLDEALKSFTEALRLKPDDADVHYDLALFLSKQDHITDAIKHYLEALRIRPYYLDASNNLAWILATHGNPSFRNGEKAVQWPSKPSN